MKARLSLRSNLLSSTRFRKNNLGANNYVLPKNSVPQTYFQRRNNFSATTSTRRRIFENEDTNSIVNSRFSSALLLGLGLAIGSYLQNSVNAEEENDEFFTTVIKTESENNENKEENNEENQNIPVYNFENKFGLDKENLPNKLNVKYLIVGGGISAFAAIKTILHIEPDAQILVVGDDSNYPYTQPALSKEVWESEKFPSYETFDYVNYSGKDDNLLFRSSDYYNGFKNVVFLRNTIATDINATKHLVLIDNEKQSVIVYEKCLICTGGTPNFPSIPVTPEAAEKISTYSKLEDFQFLDKFTRESAEGKQIAIIGSGFLGCELATHLMSRGKRLGFGVHSIYPENAVLSKVLPDYLSEYTAAKITQTGVQIHPNSQIQQITLNEEQKLVIELTNNETVVVDHAIFATGIKPNSQMARFGLEIDNDNGGIVCNAELQARSGVFAAGDVVSYFDDSLGVRRRVEHYDHALESGRVAALNMMGDAIPYSHIPMFWTEFGDFAMQGVGICDSKLRTVGVWVRPVNSDSLAESEYQSDYKKGIVYYLNDKSQIVGILFFGMQDKLKEKMNAARRLLKRRRKHQDTLSIQQSIIIEEWPEAEFI